MAHRLPALVLALLLAMALPASCGSGLPDDAAHDPPPYKQSADGPSPESVNDEPPYGAGVEVGRTYEYDLYVHCGVRWARIDGEYWETDPLGVGGNPPKGWGNPLDAGTLVLLDEDTAEYTGGPGTTVRFTRGDGTAGPDPCM